MNKENVLGLALAIETAALAEKGLGFNMETYRGTPTPLRDGDDPEEHPDKTGKHCGTCSCIAGWAAVLFSGADPRLQLEKREIARRAEVGLGLGSEDSAELFEPSQFTNYRNITAEHAVAVLRHLAETGVVNWVGFENLSPEAERTYQDE